MRQSELLNRVLVAVVAGGLAVAIIDQGGWVFAAAICALGLIGLHEYFALTSSVNPLRLAGFLGIAGLIGAAKLGGEQSHVLAAAACVFPAMLLVGFVLEEQTHFTYGSAVTLFGTLWIGLPLAFAVLLREGAHGGPILANILIGTFVGDTFAYGFGKMFGRHPLALSISPNKTQEGLAAGLVGCVAAVWFAGIYQDWLSNENALLLGAGVAVAAPLGDLFESRIKRDSGVKDSGGLFGAHGGVLDRLDAAFFTVVAGYFIWKAMAPG